MIELTKEQQQALDMAEQPPVAVDPHSGQKYRLVRQDLYEQMCGLVKPYDEAWDDPALDVYEEYRKRP